ncbi:MAG: glycosyltransferase [Rhizobacter sp.]|nr:glycosyltransferase [Rhizobacter sp.]
MKNEKEAGRVIVLTISPWDEPKRLRKQLAEVLAKDFAVTYVTLPYGLRKPARDTDHLDGTIRVLSLAGPPLPLRVLNRLSPLRFAHESWLAKRLLRHLPGRGQIDAVFCFTSNHPTLLKHLHPAPIIYVANDDHVSMASSASSAQLIRRDEAITIGLCRQVITVSEVIAGKLAGFGKPTHVMYPGHDCEALPLQRFTEETRAPRSACFFGYIDWRVDFALLKYLLIHDWEVTLIGPVIGTDARVEELRAEFQGRFLVHSAVAPEEAPDLLARYQVLMIPYRYRTREQAEVMELPNKTFIYFSALRPIVTTWMPNLKLVEPGLIYRATTPEEFLACCVQAADEDSLAHAARRQALAQQNTWDARRSTLRKLLLASKSSLVEPAT